jgi:hypothetical protein
MAVDVMAEQLVELVHFEAEFLDGSSLRREQRRLLRNGGGLRPIERLAACQIVRKFARFTHAAYDNEIAKMRKWRHTSFRGIQENIFRDHRALASAECFRGDAASKW